MSDTTVEDLLSEASAVLAGHPDLEAEWYGVGRKPIPGDGDPVLGPVDAVPNAAVPTPIAALRLIKLRRLSFFLSSVDTGSPTLFLDILILPFLDILIKDTHVLLCSATKSITERQLRV